MTRVWAAQIHIWPTEECRNSNEGYIFVTTIANDNSGIIIVQTFIHLKWWLFEEDERESEWKLATSMAEFT